MLRLAGSLTKILFRKLAWILLPWIAEQLVAHSSIISVEEALLVQIESLEMTRKHIARYTYDKTPEAIQEARSSMRRRHVSGYRSFLRGMFMIGPTLGLSGVKMEDSNDSAWDAISSASAGCMAAVDRRRAAADRKKITIKKLKQLKRIHEGSAQSHVR